MWFSLIFLFFVTTIHGFDCNNKHLENYNFDKLKGLHKISIINEFPPSISNLTWYLNVCGAIDNNDLPNCPKDSQICGLKYISLLNNNDFQPINTEIISFSNSLNPEVNPINDTFLNIQLKGANWGSNTLVGNLSFVCDDSVNDDNDEQNILIKSWDNEVLNIEWKSSSICVKGGKDDKNFIKRILNH